jgi:two-component system, OmpR family, response regulator
VKKCGVSPTLHLAVLDDEPAITQLIARYLSTHGYRVSQAHCGATLMTFMDAPDPPTLVLLDLGLPGEDGLAIARALREHHRCGLVIVSGRGESIDKVVGLDEIFLRGRDQFDRLYEEGKD